MLGLWVFKRMVGHVAINRCIFVMRWLAKGEAWMKLMLHLCRKDSSFIKEAMLIINADRSAQVPGTIPENGWEGEVIFWELGESPPAPASNPESPPPSTSPLLFDEEDPLLEPEGNIAASSSEPTVGESPAFPASNSEDMPQDGKSVKGNVKAPPQTLPSTSSSKPPTSDDARPYVFIRVPKGRRGSVGERPTIYSRAGRVACEGYP